MEFTREMLEALGVGEEQIEPILRAHDESTAALVRAREELAASFERHRRREAYAGLLRRAGVAERHLAAVLRAADYTALALTPEGEAEDEAEALRRIREEWGDFIVTTTLAGAPTAAPPAAAAPDYDAMSDSEYYAAVYAANRKE